MRDFMCIRGEDIVDSEDLKNLNIDFVYYKYARLVS
jgi:hypothetical protein